MSSRRCECTRTVWQPKAPTPVDRPRSNDPTTWYDAAERCWYAWNGAEWATAEQGINAEVNDDGDLILKVCGAEVANLGPRGDSPPPVDPVDPVEPETCLDKWGMDNSKFEAAAAMGEVDLGGCIVTLSEAMVSADVIIKNGIIVGADGAEAAISIFNGAKVTCENVVFNGPSYAMRIEPGQTGSVTAHDITSTAQLGLIRDTRASGGNGQLRELFVERSVFRDSQHALRTYSEGISRFIVINSRFENIQAPAGVVDGVNVTAIQTQADSVGTYLLIKDNIFANIGSPYGAADRNKEAHAIRLEGLWQNPTVQSNFITDVFNLGFGEGAEGIYTKVPNTRITGNTLVDAGGAQGAISTKQAAIGSRVTENDVSYTDPKNQARGGIYNEAAGAVIARNNVHDIGSFGIWSRPKEATGASLPAYSGAFINNNEVHRVHGRFGIMSKLRSRGGGIIGNTVSEVYGTRDGSPAGTPTDTYRNADDLIAYYIEPDGGKFDMTVSGNQALVGDTATGVGYYLTTRGGNTSSGITMMGNFTTFAEFGIVARANVTDLTLEANTTANIAPANTVVLNAA